MSDPFDREDVLTPEGQRVYDLLAANLRARPPRRYATMYERQTRPWCRLCGAVLDAGVICRDECLPAVSSGPVGILVTVPWYRRIWSWLVGRFLR